MEEAPSFASVDEADQLVHSVVVLADGGVGEVGLGYYRELAVGVLPPPFVSDLRNPPAVEVVAVAAQDIFAFADFARLISDVVMEGRRDAGTRLLGGIAIWVNGNRIPIPKTDNRA